MTTNLMPINSNLINLNGSQYHVRDSVSGEETVLLLHGMPDDGMMWQRQITALTEAGYRVLCPDMLGYGLTDKPEETERYKTTAVVNDLVTLLDSLGLDKIHLIGHDWGAVTGWDFAIALPNRLKSYVAMTVGHPVAWFEDSFKFERMRWNWYVLFHLDPRAPETYREGKGRLLQEVLQSHPDKERVVERLLKPGVLEAMLNWDKANSLTEAIIAMARGDFNELPPVTVPTFGISGVKDPFMWESQMHHSNRFVAAEWRYESLADAGHWLMLEQPEKINHLLLDWLSNHS